MIDVVFVVPLAREEHSGIVLGTISIQVAVLAREGLPRGDHHVAFGFRAEDPDVECFVRLLVDQDVP